MPRNVNKSGKTKIMQPSDREKYKKLQQFLGEESSESFKSATTDENLTDYRLEYTTGLGRSGNMPPPAKSPQRSSYSATRKSPQKSPVARHTRSNPLPSPEEGPSTSYQHRSPRKPAGSAKRKAKTPKRKPHVFKEIRNLQKTTKLLIPRLPFARVIRELLQKFAFDNTRITPTALEALHEAAEIYLTSLFADSYRCTLHRDRVTLMIKDMELARYLRGRSDPGNY